MFFLLENDRCDIKEIILQLFLFLSHRTSFSDSMIVYLSIDLWIDWHWMTLCQPKSLSASSLCCLLCTSNRLVLHLLEVFRRYRLQTMCGTETKWQVLRRVCRKQTKVFANLMSHIFNLVNCFSVPRVNVMRSEALLADAAFIGGFS